MSKETTQDPEVRRTKLNCWNICCTIFPAVSQNFADFGCRTGLRSGQTEPSSEAWSSSMKFNNGFPKDGTWIDWLVVIPSKGFKVIYLDNEESHRRSTAS